MTPLTIRMDATACVRRLITQGVKVFDVTVVAVGLDGKDASNLLRFNGVSLSFLD
jgi:hypothetical protein